MKNKDTELQLKDEQNIALQVAYDNLKKELIEAKLLLNESGPHNKMVSKINNQKKVTRDALAYIASISRDRSNFAIPANTEAKGEDNS